MWCVADGYVAAEVEARGPGDFLEFIFAVLQDS